MPRYATDPSLQAAGNPTAHGEPEPHEDKPPAMYRTCLPIGVVILAVATVIIVAATSSSSKVQGGKTPQVAVIVVEGLKGTTATAAFASNKMPNLQRLATEGVAAVCPTSTAATCARTQSGSRVSPYGAWTGTPGLVSLLTGVDAQKHTVFNDSSLPAFANSKYITFLRKAKQSEARVAVIAPRTHFSQATVAEGGAKAAASGCTRLGLLDVECFGVGCSEGSPTCNSNTRYAYDSDTDADVVAVATSAMQSGADVVYVHFTSANAAAVASGDYSEASNAYMSALYMIDATIGQLVEVIVGRTATANENWLVVVTSDHGGARGVPGVSTIDEDENVGFAMAAYRSGAALVLRPLQGRPSVMDVFPTVLKWLGIDVPATGTDGAVQGICSSGVLPPTAC